jgi:hypothetical protein
MTDQLVSYGETTFTPDRLFAGPTPKVARKVTLVSGAGALVRGTVLGKIALGTASAAAKAGGNTGNGTCTVDATTPVKAGAKAGIYSVRCIEVVTNNGIFEVKDPDGNQIGSTLIMAGGAGTFDDDIKFALADGSTDFIVGDGFDVTVAAGSGKYLKSLAAAVDGSQAPDAILADDRDATSGDVEAMAYFDGFFAEQALTLGTGHTVASIREGLRAKGIHLIDAQEA